MKTAVLVFGEFREFENAHKTWTFLNDIDYDMYVSTWSVSVEENIPYLNINIHENVTEDIILKYFPDSTINIEENNFYSLNSTKMIYHWRKLFNMVAISGKKYENIILIRTDIVFDIIEYDKLCNIINNKIDTQIIYNLSGIIHRPPPVFLYVQDLFFLGNIKTMRNIFLSFIPPDITYKDIHFYLSKHFINNDIYIENIFPNIIDYFVMRSIHRNFLHLDFDEQRKISEEWWELKHHNKKPKETLKLITENNKI